MDPQYPRLQGEHDSWGDEALTMAHGPAWGRSHSAAPRGRLLPHLVPSPHSCPPLQSSSLQRGILATYTWIWHLAWLQGPKP